LRHRRIVPISWLSRFESKARLSRVLKEIVAIRGN
jgi:hypothetical protein